MSSLKKNIIYQTSYQMLTILLPLVTSPYVSRVLGAENLGIYSYSYSVAYYFMMFALLGINNYGNRTIAEVRDDQDKLNRTFSSIFSVHLIVSLFSLSAYMVYLLFFVKSEKMYAWISLIYVIGAALDINWLYFGLEKFKITVTRNTLIKLLTVICIFVFVKERTDLWKYVFIMALGSFISESVIWFFVKDNVKFIRPKIKDMIVHIKPLFILFIPVLAISLYKIMDKIMIGALCEKAQVGYYSNAEKAVNIPTSIIGAFGTVMLPKMSNMLRNGDSSESRKYMDLSVRYIMLVAIGLGFGLAAVSNVFSVIFWGNEFEACGILVRLLSITVPFLAFANIIRTQYLIPKKMDKEYIISVFAGAGMNLICNAVLIPYLQAVGAAIGTIMAEVTVALIQAIQVRKALPIRIYFRQILEIAVGGIIMFLLLDVLLGGLAYKLSSLIMMVVSGAAIYLTFVIVFLVRSKDDMFMKMIRKVK